MGKQRRQKQKLHIAGSETRSVEGRRAKQSTPGQAISDLPWNVRPSDDMFSGLHIDFDNLKKSLVDDDGKSVKSLSKTIKSCSEKSLKKEDKRKLRHNLFIKKIDAIYEQVEKSKKRGKKKNKSEASSDGNMSTVEYLLNMTPTTPAVDKSGSGGASGGPEVPNKLTSGAIKKAKQRKEKLLKDVDLFKRIMAETKLVEKPLEHIRHSVEEKVVSEVI